MEIYYQNFKIISRFLVSGERCYFKPVNTILLEFNCT